MRRLLVALTLILSAPGGAQDHSPAIPSVAQIVDRLAKADDKRRAALTGYTATRRYVLINERFKKRAQMIVRLKYSHPGHKQFDVVSQEGSTLLCDKVLKRLIKTEEEASREDNRLTSQISPANYNLSMAGTETLRGRDCFMLDLTPVSKSPYLVRGRVWIDSSDYAVARLEGTLAKKPSIWVGAPKILQDYAKLGEFWLPVDNSSTTEAPLFGRTDLTIRTTDYDLAPTDPPGKPIAWYH